MTVGCIMHTWEPGSANKRDCVFLVLSQRRVDSLHPGLNEEMYRAARHVLLCLRELVDSGVSPCDGTKDDSQLRQLQQEVTAHFSFMLRHVFILFAIKSLSSVFSHRGADAV